MKFFLHVSSSEQRKRFLERIDDPEAHWKFQAADVRERQYFDDYLSAYQDALNETSRPWAPWYAVPADDKDYLRRTVAAIIVETLRQLDLHYPTASREERLAMAAAKKALQSETAMRSAG